MYIIEDARSRADYRAEQVSSRGRMNLTRARCCRVLPRGRMKKKGGAYASIYGDCTSCLELDNPLPSKTRRTDTGAMVPRRILTRERRNDARGVNNSVCIKVVAN